MKYNLVSQLDEEYMEGNSYWGVELNNGEIFYKYDINSSYSSWERLKEYCSEYSLYIVKMWIRFRSNSVALPSDKMGYFFVNSSMSGCGMSRTLNYFIVGYIEEGVVKVEKFQVPEMLSQGKEDRVLDINSPCLILKKY